jgi:WD40 repeat protein
VRPGELDAERFARLVEDGCHALAAGEAEHAADVLREALALWRGPPLADFAFEAFAQTEIARLQEQRLAAVEARIEADLAAGRHPALVGELRQLVAGSPTRERLAGQLMLALYRCGQQADALEAYHVTRHVLADIGVQPGPELRRLQEAILRQDRSLEPPAAVSELPPELDTATEPPLEGRDGELAWLRERWERARTGRGTLVTVAGVRGIGKSRLAAELAGEVHRLGAAVLYANASGPAERALVALGRAREATRPTLLVVDDADQAGAEVLAELVALARALASSPVLALASGRDADALARLGAADALALEPLDAQAVRAIAIRYAPGHVGVVVPVDWLFGASGGIPRRVHDAARQWARREAARRVGAVAERTATGRAELRSMESELAGDVVELQAADERGATDDESPTVVVCPFKGLASFDVVDAPYFFGRERLVAELVARLVGAPLLGVVGPSGSGKSSVMRAGLLPALASGVLPGSDTWTQALIRPGEHPLRALNEAMTGTGDAERVVLAVDQFEETFTTCEDEVERAAFIAELARMAGEVESHSVVVIALRADYYGRCAAYPELAGQLASNHVLVRSMQRDELRRAIKLPAQRVGLRVDPELAEALVADVKDEPGALPLLSTALLELWQRRDGRRLRYTVYEQTGGVDGAVARLAEDAFGELDDEQQVIARGILMRLAGEGAAGGVERRRVALTELETDRNEDVARIVALLTDRRLLTASSGTIELAHEALMREWPRLRDWIDADREGLRIHRNLNAAAREWEGLGRDDGALYRGARLTEAIEWAEAQQPRLNETERAFLEASEVARQRDRVTRRRRIALAFGSLVVMLVAISVVAAGSISHNREARRQRDIAASRDLAARAAGLVDFEPGLSRLIALAAYKRYPTEQAESAVRQATFDDRATAILPAGGHVSMTTPSADGRFVATAQDNDSVRVWDLRHRRVSSTINVHGPATAAGFSPDGTKIATADTDGEVAVADVNGKNASVLLTIKRGTADHPTYPTSVEFSSNASRLVVAAGDGTVRLINLRDRTSRVLGRHPGRVRRARFNKGATKVVSAGAHGLTKIWTVASGASVSLIGGDAGVRDASFSPDGRRVATASVDGYLRIWDVASGNEVLQVKVVPQYLLSVRYNRDGRQLVMAAEDGVVRVYDAREALLLQELKGSVGYVSDAAFVAGGAIVSGGEAKVLQIWAPVETMALRGDAMPSPSFSTDPRYVIWGDALGYVHRWNIDTGRDRRLPDRAASNAAALVQQSADGSRLVTAPAGSEGPVHGEIRLYDAKRNRLLRSAPSNTAQPYAITIDRSGRRVALAGRGPLIRVQADDGSGRIALRGHKGDVYGLAFSPDAKHLASASADGTARIFTLGTAKLKRTLRHPDPVMSVAYSADGKRLLTGGADAIIRIWPVKGGAPTVLYGHRGAINSAVFNPHGNRVVSAGEDGAVRVWDDATGGSLVVLHQYEVANSAEFSRDGKLVVSQGGEGSSNNGILRVTACEVCGQFAGVLQLAQSRADLRLNTTDRQRLLGEAP